MTITEIPLSDDVTITSDTLSDGEIAVTLESKGTGMWGDRYHAGVALTGTPDQIRDVLRRALAEMDTMAGSPSTGEPTCR